MACPSLLGARPSARSLSSRASLSPPAPRCAAAVVSRGRAGRLVTRAYTLVEERVVILTPSGPMHTLLLRPSVPGKFPGIVLYSEIFQTTGPIKRSAQFLACHGFVVAVPDIYHEFEAPGTAFSYEGSEGVARGNALKVEKTCAAYDADSAASVASLRAHPCCTGAVGVTGFCIGGHLSFRAAMNVSVRSAACFYATDLHKGSLGKGGDDSLARMGELAAHGTEMLMFFGRQDPHVPLEGRVKIAAALNSAGVNFSWHEVNGAHAFMRDEGSAGRYDGELALACYSMVIALFRRTLSGDAAAPAGAAAGAGVSTH